jgi:two-component system response regulator (stage 0 sporulation protein F)
MTDQRVLIVDDEQRTLILLRESLVVAGLDAEFVCAASAEEALKAFAQRPFDAVVMDVRLSGMDGLELLERLRQDFPATRVIVVSAYDDLHIEDQVRKLGAHGFFHKPFAFEEFTSAVAGALRDVARDKNASRAHPMADWQAQFVQRQLTALMRDTSAQCVLLTNGGGAVVARAGVEQHCYEVLPVPVPDQESVFNFAYHQGKTHDIYSADVGSGLRLSLVFDRNQPSSRIGLVLQYTRRTVQELASIFGATETPLPTAPLASRPVQPT